jgi:KipI family sensor histidine kinase inhibitor
MTFMRVRPVGRDALLLEVHEPGELEAWRQELWRRRAAGELNAVEIVPGATTILLDGVAPGAADLIRSWPAPSGVAVAAGPLVELPVVFDGADLADVAEHWGVDPPTVVRRLADAELRVAFSGFAPGFAYLSGLPTEWAVPRRPTPRPRVPAGSVALAGGYAGVYPTASPGGWQLVGRTAETLFDVRRTPPALLAPGVRVRLRPVP